MDARDAPTQGCSQRCLMYVQRKASEVKLKRLKRLLNNSLYICGTVLREAIPSWHLPAQS